MTSLSLALLLALGVLFPLEIKRAKRAIRQNKHGQSPSNKPQLVQGPIVLGICITPGIILAQSGSTTIVTITFILLILWASLCLQKLSMSQEVLNLLKSRNQKI